MHAVRRAAIAAQQDVHGDAPRAQPSGQIQRQRGLPGAADRDIAAADHRHRRAPSRPGDAPRRHRGDHRADRRQQRRPGRADPMPPERGRAAHVRPGPSVCKAGGRRRSGGRRTARQRRRPAAAAAPTAPARCGPAGRPSARRRRAPRHRPAARRAGSASIAATHAVRAAASATRVRPPAASSTCAASRKLAICGPTATAQPNRAGSSGFCPPPGRQQAAPDEARCRPAGTTARARPECRPARRPCSGGAAPSARRRTARSPAAAAISAPRSGWRGTRMVSRPGCAASSARCAAKTSASSPGCVLAASQTGRPASSARSRASSAGSAGSFGAANFRSPGGADRGGAKRLQPRRVGRRARLHLGEAAQHERGPARGRAASRPGCAPTSAH